MEKTSSAQINLLDEIIVDNFAGGGGASTGIELATGRPVTIAINHDPAAILMHKTNHPHTMHLQASVWDVDPEEVCAGRPVGLAWFSPDCKHFSKVKGSALVDRNIRGLAWIVLRWAGTVRPRVIILENVEEFTTWGPVRKGKPIKSKQGQTFQKWLGQLEALGYAVEYRELVAADYGAPTTRKRFVLIARCDGQPIKWPERTHAPRESAEVKAGKLLPWRSAAEIIDWTVPMYSVFESKQEIKEKYGVNAVRPLADNTLRRIIRGVDKFTIKSGDPFIVPTGYGERKGQAPRVHDIHAPLPTVVSTGKQNLVQPVVSPFLHTVHAGGYNGKGNTPDKPLNTVTSAGGLMIAAHHIAEFKGQDIGQSIDKPLRTITASAGEFGFVGARVEKYAPGTELGYWPEVRALLNKYCGHDLADDEVLILHIGGAWWFISDIKIRMLTPRELYAAMGFPPDYIIERDYTGKPYPKSQQVARCGNAVCPQMAAAVVRANMPEWAVVTCTMAELNRVIAV